MKNLIKLNSKNAQNFGKDIVAFQHKLAETGLFSEEKLAEVIDGLKDIPGHNYTLGTFNVDGYSDVWKTGILGDASGKEILEAIKMGRLWLQIQNLDLVAPEHRAVTEQIFAEIDDQVPDFSYSNLVSSILISSPAAKVLCHSDVAEVVLLHIQGRKRFFLYDGDNEDYLPKEVLEGVVLRETEEDIPYKPEWDKSCHIFDLEPGQAMNWPQFWPHKVDNIAGLNISLQCEFFSDEARRRYGVYYTNGLMRRKAGINPQSVDHNGAGALMKCGMALMAKKMKVHKSQERKIVSSFVVDVNEPGGFKMIDEKEQKVLAK